MREGLSQRRGHHHGARRLRCANAIAGVAMWLELPSLALPSPELPLSELPQYAVPPAISKWFGPGLMVRLEDCLDLRNLATDALLLLLKYEPLFKVDAVVRVWFGTPWGTFKGVVKRNGWSNDRFQKP